MPDLINACDRDLGGLSTTPQMGEALDGWIQAIEIGFVTQRQDPRTFTVNDIVSRVAAQGNLQPFRDRDLELLPEGDRSWINKKLFIKGTLALVPSSIIFVDGVKYRVMGNADWSREGYVRYRLVDDFNLGNVYGG